MINASVEEIEQWICDRGLNNEMLHEYPPHLHRYCGADGERIWQYPCQFAPYLAFLRDYFKGQDMVDYLEIGSRWGGTLRATIEFLRLCGNDVWGLGLDPEGYEERHLLSYATMPVASTSELGKHEIETINWDLVLIDGDHSREGVLTDWGLVKDRSRLVAFHDICSDVCPDVGGVFSQLAAGVVGEPWPRSWEFMGQYPEVAGSYMGIGVIERRKERW
jgi:hypothetical protein